MYYLFEVFHTISFLTSKLLKHINDTLEEQGSNANNVHKDYTASYQCWNRKCSRTNSWEYFQAILFIRPACLWSSKYFFYMQEKIFLYWLVSILSFQGCLFSTIKHFKFVSLSATTANFSIIMKWRLNEDFYCLGHDITFSYDPYGLCVCLFKDTRQKSLFESFALWSRQGQKKMWDASCKKKERQDKVVIMWYHA